MEVHENNAVAQCEPEKCIELVSEDRVKFLVPLPVIARSALLTQFIQDMGYNIKDVGGIGPIPIPNIMSDILKLCLDFLEHHMNDKDMSEEEKEKWKSSLLTGWDARFADMKTPDGKVDIEKIFKLILAANFLDIKLLLDTMCKAVAHLLRGKTDEETRLMFGINEPFTKEEEDEVRKNNPWCDDKL
jgi:S-phase kinase-associated protein 1